MVITLLTLNAGAWFLVQGAGSEWPLVRSFCLHGLIPADLLGLVGNGRNIDLGVGVCRLDGVANLWTLVSHMFLHGGWLHLLGNLWFLWIFGDIVEDRMGPVRFTLFYLVCGLAAAFAQILSDPASAIPMVGASGAIGGVMGAYARLYPRARIHTLLFLGIFITTIQVPAFLMLGYWFLLQLLGGLPQLGGGTGGVAFWAHIGGFAAGWLLVRRFEHPGRRLAPASIQDVMRRRF